MNIAIGSDHRGYQLKKHIIEMFSPKGYNFTDLGTTGEESVDYSDFGIAVAQRVAQGECELGIVICSTGVGISIAANKVKGIRAAHCTDSFCAKMARRHNNANVLALGASVTGVAIAEEIVENFLNETFEGGRHQKRIDKITQYESRH
jgi:ribose 5-phosphate isomerase B